MTFETYNFLERENIRRLAANLLVLFRPFLGVGLTRLQWLLILAAAYPFVLEARIESARLARAFYDSERLRVAVRAVQLDDIEPEPARHPIYLAEYRPEWFESNMEAVREDFSDERASESDLATLVGVGIKEAQNGGRRTTVRAVETDPKVLGWARVEGGGESCAFCLMLISRGPVYRGADTAGLKVRSNTEAVEIWRQYNQTGDDELLMSLMNRWHENCDCRVVPVFDRSNWPGREEYLEAERLWVSTTSGLSGRDKLNGLRRLIGDGYKRDIPQRIAA